MLQHSGRKRFKERKRISRSVGAFLTALCLLAAIGGFAPAQGKSQAIAEIGKADPADRADDRTGSGTSDSVNSALAVIDTGPYYSEMLESWQRQGAKPADASVEIAAQRTSAVSPEANVTIGEYNGKSNVLKWENEKESWIEYDFEVEREGLYELRVAYHPFVGQSYRRPITWAVSIDGKFPFREARSIQLDRQWQDERPIRQDEDGDDIRPKSKDISGWSEKSLYDTEGAYAEPLQWFLGPGKHKLRLTGKEPVALERITIAPPMKPGSYADVSARYVRPVQTSAEVQVIEAEEMLSKNDSSIQVLSDNDAGTTPLAGGHVVFNTVGGLRWEEGNKEITWSFHVPESGRYKLAVRSLQGFYSNKSSFRTIRIDGKVPFAELLSYRFPYSAGWKGSVITDPSGTPYEVYLEQGDHTLSMRTTYAPNKQALIGLEKAVEVLRGVDEDLKALTGGVDDQKRTWKISRDLPDLPERLQQVADSLNGLAGQLLESNGKRDLVVQGLQSAAKDIDAMLDNPDTIPHRMDRVTSLQGKISDFFDLLVWQPLQLDKLYIAPADQPFPRMEAPFFSKLKGMLANFIYSFRNKNKLTDMNDDVLNVWVNRGRDHVNMLQQLADESFTPEHGIKVKVNLLPTTQVLLLANAAGIQPDVALGLNQSLPVDYAIRNSIRDMSEFPDFKQVFDKFSPGAWLPYFYNGGYYGVPETQSFNVLFYRKDIMNKLGLKIPDTWQDVYDMLPTLQEKHLNFYMPPNEFQSFFYQNGAEMYAGNGMKTALDSPESFKAFKQWTDQFNIYAMLPEVASFYQHFRSGDIPIGVADYNLYITLSVAAPELNGWWGIAPLPGTKQPDGTVVRWSGGGQTAGIIFKGSKKQEQAWEFMKWWVSADIQEQFGSDLEMSYGTAFRWNTANVEAFSKLPWKREDADVILEQWRWFKEMPNLPGGYFLQREMMNAWNRNVLDGMNGRTSLELAIDDIERELKRKQQEFGFVESNGDIVHTLDLPSVSEPWKGVDPYVD